MRILLDLRWVRSQTLDGIARVSLNLTSELLATESEHVYILLFENDSLRQFCLHYLRARQPLKANFIAHLTGFNAFSPRNRLQLWSQLKAYGPELYLSFYWLFHPLPLPNLCMVHDLIPLRFPSYFQAASPAFKLLMTHPRPLKWLLSQAQCVLTVSENSRQDLHHLLDQPLSKLALCQPGVDLKSPPASCPTDLKPGYLLALARPDPHKNFAGCIRAFALLPPELRQAHPLVLAGPADPRYTPGLQALIHELNLSNEVRVRGPVPAAELNGLYQHASLFLFPSLYEGFGLPVLEAMAQGTPVLTSPLASLPEVAGQAAEYADPLNPEELATRIKHLLSCAERRQALSKAGKQQAASFSWQKSAQQLQAIFRQQLHHKSS